MNTISLISCATRAAVCLAALMLTGATAMAAIPRPEHPRPGALRSEWLNLNGVWDFAETGDGGQTFLADAAYPDRITVPFCRESELSGLGRKGFVTNVWYRRSFQRPKGWKSPRTRLHIGACDWKTDVWVNGRKAGTHVGGSAPFAFDITQLLKDGENTVIIHAFDDTRSHLQALGKQCDVLESHGCLYTRTTGIWQTVWLEGVGSSFIRDFHIQPDAEKGQAVLDVEVDGAWRGMKIRATATADGKPAAKATAEALWRNGRLTLNLKPARLWSPSDPFLYDLNLELLDGAKVVDQVRGYFGLRSVSIQGAAILLNGKAVFQRLVLDQGFYPDGIWSAPSEEALKRDIELSMAAGFNGARLHQKVFEPRFLYWADRLGYLVWGEFPNWGLNYADQRVNLPVIDEWVEIVRRDRNHPSVIGWCPFNETPADAIPLQNTVVNMTRLLDPSRPIIDTSGWTHGLPDAEVLDDHNYDQNPDSFRKRWLDGYLASLTMPARYGGAATNRLVPFMVSEYGGIGWDTGTGWGYGVSPKTLDEFHERYAGLARALLDNRLMFGFCYTQLTDVEQERNGIYTYDRKPKFDMKRIHAATAQKSAYEKEPPLEVSTMSAEWRTLAGAAVDGGAAQMWRFTTDRPAAGWEKAGFEDASWKQSKGAFGQKDGFENLIVQKWDTSDIWLRSSFRLDDKMPGSAMLVIHYDNDTEVYLNGQLLWQADQWNDAYAGFDVSEAFRKHAKPGANTLAVHCTQHTGGQFIDLAILGR